MPDAPIAFFSYSREDSDFALRLANDLRAAGSAVWIDQLDIGPGERWDRVVQQALESCPTVLIILSPASVNSNNVMDEVSFALDQQKAIIPVLYRDCDIPFRVRRFQHVDFRDNYEHMLEELKRCLHLATSSAPAAPVPIVQPPTPPAPSPQAPSSPPSPVQQHGPVEHETPRPSHAQTKPPRAGFPAWAKIAIAVVAILILGVVLMNMGSKAGKRALTEPSSDLDKTFPSDLNKDDRLNTEAAGSTAAKVEVLRTALTTDESPPPCRFPESHGSPEFSVTDTKIWYAFEFRGGAPDDQWTVTWFRPNAGHNFVNYLTQTLKNTATGHGTYCYFIKVAGTPVQNMPGYWSVQLERNGESVDSQEFLLSK